MIHRTRALFAVLLFCAAPLNAGLDTALLESVLGMKGTVEDDEFKIALPQKDLAVTVDGFSIVPAVGLTSWVAFTSHKKHAMAMGDPVLLEDEIGPVQKTAVEAGFGDAVVGTKVMFLRENAKRPSRLAADIGFKHNFSSWLQLQGAVEFFAVAPEKGS